MGVLSRRHKPKTPEPAEEELMQIRRPLHTWRLLCKYDPTFPDPDPEFINTLAEHRVIVPLSRLQDKRPPDERRIEAEVLQYARKQGWAAKPEELVYFPMHNPLYAIKNTIHVRSAHTETPVELVRVRPEYTFKGPGYRTYGYKSSFTYAPYEELRERRWQGFALAQTTRHAVNVSLAVHKEFDVARKEVDPVVAEAVENGFTEAPTLKYGCVVRPLQTLVYVRDPGEHFGQFPEMFTTEEKKRIREKGRGVYPVDKGAEINLFLDLRSRANEGLISILTLYQKDDYCRREALKLIDESFVNCMAREHNIEVKLGEDNVKLIDHNRDEEITPQQAIDLIRERNERMIREADTITKDMVVFGYTVPF